MAIMYYCLFATQQSKKEKNRELLLLFRFLPLFCWSRTLKKKLHIILNESDTPKALTLLSLILSLFLPSCFTDSTLNKPPYHASRVGYTVSLTELSTSGTCLAPVLLS